MADRAAQPVPRADASESADLDELLHFIRDARGFDFAGYKRLSLTRRIRKRMHDVAVSEYRDYRDLLETSTEEFGQLFNTILINVTAFFRDPEAWSYLGREVIPRILDSSDVGSEIRVWSAGCSSGEEAYTLAMVFAEAIGMEESTSRLKIYGTDVDKEALRDARAAVYPAKALEHVPEELRHKYFQADTGGRFAFRPELRRRVVFGYHDITRDAPISRLNLLVCRNTLMYFNVEAQSHILDRFHFALREGGYLFLGRAETLTSHGGRFEVDSARQRIFRRRTAEWNGRYRPVEASSEQGESGGQESNRQRQLRDLVLEGMPSAGIALDPAGRIDFINAQARVQYKLSAHDVGRAFYELEVSYRPAELRSVIERATSERRTVRLESVERRLGPDEVSYVDIVIVPLRIGESQDVGVALFFIDVTTQSHLRQEVRKTREDLETAYEELQSINEELETTNEELQSSVEELETTNEELQSTNEELETTNQELQSGNDELGRLIEEGRQRSVELDEARGFLEGVLSSVATGVVVLDSRLRVRTWNRGAVDLWGLSSGEVQGKAFFDLEFGLPLAKLHESVDDCVATGQRVGPTEIEAVNRIGRSVTCSVTCSPLGRPDGGAVLLMEESRR